MNSLCVDDEGDIWLLSTMFERDEYGNDNARITLTERSNDGAKTRSSDISYLFNNYSLIPNKILIDDDGYMYLATRSQTGSSLVLLDTKREALNEKSVVCILSGGSDIARLSTGEIIIGDRIDSGYELKLVNITNLGWGKSWSLEIPFSRIHSGNDDYLFLDDGVNIFKFFLGSGELSLQANCFISGIRSFGKVFSEIKPNHYLILRIDDNDYTDVTRVLTILEDSATIGDEPIILRLATFIVSICKIWFYYLTAPTVMIR